VRGIKSIYIKDFEAQVDNSKITSYRINAKVILYAGQSRYVLISCPGLHSLTSSCKPGGFSLSAST